MSPGLMGWKLGPWQGDSGRWYRSRSRPGTLVSSQLQLRVLSLSLADDTVGTFLTQIFSTFTFISFGCDMCML